MLGSGEVDTTRARATTNCTGHCRHSRAALRGRLSRRGPVHSLGQHHEEHRRTACRRANAGEFSRARRGGEVDTTSSHATTDRRAYFGCARSFDSREDR